MNIECLEARLALSVVAGGTGAGNTTPPIDDPGFANVGMRGGASAVYLGNGWVLTATHVGPGTTIFNNVSYNYVASSAIQLPNPPGVAYTANSDLTLYQIDGRPNLPSLTIQTAAPAVGWNVTMVGYGRDRQPDLLYWTTSWQPSATPAAYTGYLQYNTQTVRWGTNTITATGIPVGAGVNSNSAFATSFDNIANDAQGASGDSGGGVFYKDSSGNWNLAGLMFAVSAYASQPSNITVFGNQTYIANLSVYRSQILSIIGVNQAPGGADQTVTTLQGSPYTFSAADFGFNDAGDTWGGALQAVKISALPTAGLLTDNNLAVAAGQYVSVADILAGKLKFMPTGAGSGAGYASFTFQVQDNGGTANGGSDLDPTPNTLTVNVTNVNDAPAGTDAAVSVVMNQFYSFSLADFGFSDTSDTPANCLLAVEISTLPTAGSLTNNGVAVVAGQFIAASDISAGLLRFTPAANDNGAGYASFTFQVQDNGGVANGGVDLDPTPNTITVNVAPVNNAPDGADKTITILQGAAYAFVVADFGFSDPNDMPGNSLLAVKISTLPTAGSLTNNGVAVTAGQYISLASISGGLFRFTPAAGASGVGYANFTFQVQDNGGVANNGADLDPTPNTITFNVTPVNDAPVGSDKTITILQGAAYAFVAADFGFSDPNDTPANTLLAVKISTLPTAGSLTNNGVAVVAGQSISLASINGGLLRFTPAAGASGAAYASFTFQVQDDGGTVNGGIDLDPTPNTITVNVTNVNDAPSGANATVAVVANAVYTFSLADFGFSDPTDTPANSLLAVKISALPTAGSLTNNGVAVVAGQFIAAPDINAGQLRFTPAAGASGIGYASFTFQVQDNGGVANGGVDLDPTPNTITVNVTPVNNAPSGADKTIAILQGAAYAFVAADFGFSDPTNTPANTLLAVKISTLPTAGSLTNNGVAVVAGQSITLASINGGLLRFTPAAGASGAAYASFTFQVQDNGGVASGGVDLDPTPNTITFNVTPVNDAPAGADKTITILQGAAYAFVAADFGFSDPNDTPANALLAVKISTLPTAGSLTNNGVAVVAGQTISLASINGGLLRFTPAAGAIGAPYASFTFQVQDDGGTSNGGIDLDPTPNTIAFNITAVNDAPAGADKSITIQQGASYTFVAADFGFSDPNDAPANALLAVKISSLPTVGSLTNNGVAVIAGQLISVADINAGLLHFTPATGASGAAYASFTFQVQDNGGVANGGVDLDPTPNTITFNVTGVVVTTTSVWTTSAVPATLDSGDPQAVEVGMKFTSNTSGLITGVRFYKAAGNTGVHTGSLWSASGQLLATGTFTNETTSGWQTLVFTTPVAIVAGVTYTASYHTNVGHFSVTRGGFNSALTSGPFTVPANGGVYAYGAGGFPSQTYGGSNYWVDVVLTTMAAADTTPPTVIQLNPASGATNVSTSGSLTITFSEALSAASVNNSTIQLLDGASVVAANVSYTAGSNSVTLTPTAALANSKTYTISISSATGVSSGVKDAAGNALATTVTSTFTTAAAAPTTTSVWTTSAVPATVDSGDPQAVEVGMKFTSSTSGFITGVRFYKAVGNTGVHTGSLWSASGQLLATGTFTNETTSGWQTLLFTTPVAITAGVTYTASYHTNVGHFSVTRGGLNSALTSGPFTVLANGGMYLYGAGGFPSQTYGGSNYWVDVLLSTTAPTDTTPPTVTAINPANGATGVATSGALTITFSEALSAASVNAGTVKLLDGSTQVAATVTYNAGSNTVTLTPTAALANSKTYTISISAASGVSSGVRDVAGNALAATVTSTFTTAAAAPATMSVWPSGAVPATLDSGDPQSVELGMKFTVNVSGYITGVRFYKAVGNTGVHTGSLWSSTGQLLATGTFVNETASGWQTLVFATPVAVTAGVMYTASYHTNVGHFSVTRGGFTSATVSGPFTVPANGGVYLYGAGGFPSQTYGASNYWIDVLFAT